MDSSDFFLKASKLKAIKWKKTLVECSCSTSLTIIAVCDTKHELIFLAGSIRSAKIWWKKKVWFWPSFSLIYISYFSWCFYWQWALVKKLIEMRIFIKKVHVKSTSPITKRKKNMRVSICNKITIFTFPGAFKLSLIKINFL